MMARMEKQGSVKKSIKVHDCFYLWIYEKKQLNYTS